MPSHSGRDRVRSHSFREHSYREGEGFKYRYGSFYSLFGKKKYSIKWYVLKRKNYFKFNGKSINLQSFEWFEFIIFIKVLRAVTIGIAGPAATEYVGQEAPHSLLPQLLFGSLGLSLLTSLLSFIINIIIIIINIIIYHQYHYNYHQYYHYDYHQYHDF